MLLNKHKTQGIVPRISISNENQTKVINILKIMKILINLRSINL